MGFWGFAGVQLLTLLLQWYSLTIVTYLKTWKGKYITLLSALIAERSRFTIATDYSLPLNTFTVQILLEACKKVASASG